MSLTDDIQHALNTASRENTSNTPDFLLAAYLLDCLEAYERATSRRDHWYGIDLRPGWRPGWTPTGDESDDDHDDDDDTPAAG